jgi:hypothetical protein
LCSDLRVHLSGCNNGYRTGLTLERFITAMVLHSFCLSCVCKLILAHTWDAFGFACKIGCDTKLRRKGFDSLIWSLWKERNWHVHDRVALRPVALAPLILEEARRWVVSCSSRSVPLDILACSSHLLICCRPHLLCCSPRKVFVPKTLYFFLFLMKKRANYVFKKIISWKIRFLKTCKTCFSLREERTKPSSVEGLQRQAPQTKINTQRHS